MKRFLVLFAVIGLVIATSGCSIKEVQLWFQVHQNTAITSSQAKNIADAVNAKRTPGCDPFYTANPTTNTSGTTTSATPTTCVPDNVASVHCAGSTGDGPAVEGPLKVGGYDPFDLDKDGDKAACVDPVGSIDVLGQVLTSQIHLAGWTFDPNTTDPIHYTVTDNGTDSDHIANGTRADINTAFGGVGTAHGYDLTIDESASPAQTHQICVTAKNVLAGADQKLGCKTINLQSAHDDDSDPAHDVVGVIEGADRVAGGIHIRGFAWDAGTGELNTLPTVGYGAAEDPTTVTALTQTVARPDLVADTDFNLTGGTATYGFDFVAPAPAGSSLANASSVCLYNSTGTSSKVQLMCRPVNS